eukprot:14858741-Alexandrium_andersonii.AAC.1
MRPLVRHPNKRTKGLVRGPALPPSAKSEASTSGPQPDNTGAPGAQRPNRATGIAGIAMPRRCQSPFRIFAKCNTPTKKKNGLRNLNSEWQEALLGKLTSATRARAAAFP